MPKHSINQLNDLDVTLNTEIDKAYQEVLNEIPADFIDDLSLSFLSRKINELGADDTQYFDQFLISDTAQVNSNESNTNFSEFSIQSYSIDLETNRSTTPPNTINTHHQPTKDDALALASFSNISLPPLNDMQNPTNTKKRKSESSALLKTDSTSKKTRKGKAYTEVPYQAPSYTHPPIIQQPIETPRLQTSTEKMQMTHNTIQPLSFVSTAISTAYQNHLPKAPKPKPMPSVKKKITEFEYFYSFDFTPLTHSENIFLAKDNKHSSSELFTPIKENKWIKFEKIYPLNEMLQIDYLKISSDKVYKSRLSPQEKMELYYQDGKYSYEDPKTKDLCSVIPLSQPTPAFVEEELLKRYTSFHLLSDPQTPFLTQTSSTEKNPYIYKSNSLITFFADKTLPEQSCRDAKQKPRSKFNL